MAAIIYPLTLPGPGLSEVVPSERRVYSDLAGPLKLRGLQQDYLGTQRVEWFFSAAEAEIFQAWWTDTLAQGGAWFASTWPVPAGWVSAVRRFIGDPQWAHVPGGYWTVRAQVTVRGRGMDPTVGTQPPPGFDTSKANMTSGVTYTNSNKTCTHLGGGSNYLTVPVHRPRSAGKYCWEMTSHTTGLVQEFGWACKAALPIAASIQSSPNNTNASPYGYFSLYVGSGAVHLTLAGTALSLSPFGGAHTYMFAVDFNTSAAGSKVWFGVDGVWVGSPGVSGGVTGQRLGAGSPAISSRGDFGASSVTARLTTADLLYGAPSGFLPWGDKDDDVNDA